MQTSPSEKELVKRNAQLEKENALLRELVSVLRELPGNRERETPAGKPHEEAAAEKPRKRKRPRRARAVPGNPGVDPQAPPQAR